MRGGPTGHITFEGGFVRVVREGVVRVPRVVKGAGASGRHEGGGGR